jgi:tRNA modification GTPase
MPSDGNTRPGARDWIAAPATSPGQGAIAIVRLDGTGCWEVARKVWTPLDPHADPSTPPPARRLTLGEVGVIAGSMDQVDGVDPMDQSFTVHSVHPLRRHAPADEALLVWFPAPHSYTGNDLVEFHCHGSPAVVEAVMEALVAAGARLARPGEFTERAFFNGRLDLAQAEGVANLIASRTREASQAALSQLRGALSREVLAIRDGLLDAAAEIEARLDFPEEEIECAERERLLGVLQESKERLERLLATSRRGRLLRDGARVVIAGKPNAGKSSLFNELIGMERAIVTPHPGTTRDSLEATLDIQGIPVVLVDTAGVRELSPESGVRSPETGDLGRADRHIEHLGIERTLKEMESADLVLFVVDGSAETDAEDAAVHRAIGSLPHLLVANKSDLPPAQDDPSLSRSLPEARSVLRVSALRQTGLNLLEKAIAVQILGARSGAGLEGSVESVLVTNLRHAECLRKALDALERARFSIETGESGELTMVDLYETLDSLGEIVGLAVDDEILSRIFSRFCIGK